MGQRSADTVQANNIEYCEHKVSSEPKKRSLHGGTRVKAGRKKNMRLFCGDLSGVSEYGLHQKLVHMLLGGDERADQSALVSSVGLCILGHTLLRHDPAGERWAHLAEEDTVAAYTASMKEAAAFFKLYSDSQVHESFRESADVATKKKVCEMDPLLSADILFNGGRIRSHAWVRDSLACGRPLSEKLFAYSEAVVKTSELKPTGTNPNAFNK